MLEMSPSPDAAQMLHNLKLELESLEAEVVNMSPIVALDRVTELMVKFDSVPVASTQLRASRKNAISRLHVLDAGLRDGAN